MAKNVSLPIPRAASRPLPAAFAARSLRIRFHCHNYQLRPVFAPNPAGEVDRVLQDVVVNAVRTAFAADRAAACLVAIMAQGLGYHRQVEADFRRVSTENHSDAKVMTSAGALIHGLKKLGVKKMSLLAPYMKPLTDKVVAYIENERIEVQDRICFEIPDNLEVGRRDPMRLLDEVKRLNVANVDVVVLSACVQMQSIPAIQSAQDMLGIPVTSTSMCTVRNMLDRLGLDALTPGY